MEVDDAALTPNKAPQKLQHNESKWILYGSHFAFMYFVFHAVIIVPIKKFKNDLWRGATTIEFVVIVSRALFVSGCHAN